MIDLAEAEALRPDEDPDELYRGARVAMIWWLSTVEPFLGVRFRYVEHDMERIGRELTAPRCQVRPPPPLRDGLVELIQALGEETEWWREWRGIRDDGGAAGW